MNDGIGLVDKMVEHIVNPLIWLLFALGTFFFMWGLVVFMYDTENSSERKKGLDHMIWGMVGMLIMVTVYGIISIVTNTFGISLPSLK